MFYVPMNVENKVLADNRANDKPLQTIKTKKKNL
jgi:hypothetical protein